jgi:release factor glutamine methyltransferase
MFRVGIERRSAGEPLAYITGVKEFWSLPLTVAPGVLVPRPETELLVELCLALPATTRVADLGTGSGAIAIALASERPDWQVIATDVSAEALDIAAINCRRLHVGNVELRQGRWCEALDGSFDAIVSNPPYIAPGDAALAALAHEPQMALVAADEGFADLLEIAAGARARLRPGGRLLLEHGAIQAATLAARLAGLGYVDIHCHRDLAGHDRVTAAIWPGPADAGTVWP